MVVQAKMMVKEGVRVMVVVDVEQGVVKVEWRKRKWLKRVRSVKMMTMTTKMAMVVVVVVVMMMTGKKRRA